jgi:phosphate/sulfate permease
LQSKGLSADPVEFGYLQVAAPIILLILTRMRIPVSTTFMLLTSFSGSLSTITGMFQKSLSGYFIAFTVAIAIWFLLARPLNKLFKGKAHPGWVAFQWISSGSLWYLWIAQDAANIAVYLPRSLSLNQVLFFCAYIFAGLGLLFYLKGDKIQGIVNEKSNVTDVRSATIIDLVYAFILFWFQNLNTIPMSTTWVFIGLLAGREIGMKLSNFRQGPVKLKKTMRLIGKDVLYVTMGLTVSMILAISVNGTIRKEVFAAIAAWF